MKIDIEVTKKVKETVNVEFPMYAETGDTFESGDWYESFHKLESTGKITCITVRGNGWTHDTPKEYELEVRNTSLSREIEFFRVNVSNEKSFEITVNEFLRFVKEHLR